MYKSIIDLIKKPTNLAFFFSLTALVLNSFYQILIAPLILKYGVRSDLDIWYLVFQIYSLTLMLDLGLSQGVIKWLGFYYKKDKSLFSDVYRTAQFVFVFIGLAYLTLLIFLSLILPNVLDNLSDSNIKQVRTLLGMLGLWGVFRFYFLLAKHYNYAIDNRIIYTKIDVIIFIIRIVLSLVLFRIYKTLYVLTLSLILSEFITLVHYYVKIPLIKGTYKVRFLKDIISFGVGNALIGIASSIISYSSAFFISKYINVTSVSVFQCSIMFFVLIYRIYMIPGDIFYPKVIHLISENRTVYLIDKVKSHWIQITLMFLSGITVSIILNKFFVGIWVGENMYAGFKFSVYASFLYLIMGLRHNLSLLYKAYNQKIFNVGLCHFVEIILFLSIFYLLEKSLVNLILSMIVGHMIPFLYLLFSCISYISKSNENALVEFSVK